MVVIKMNVKKLNHIFILLIICLTLYLVVYSNSFGDLTKVIRETKIRYLEIALVMMILDWFFDGLVLNNITKTVHGKINYFKSLKIAVIGQYYSAITPFSTGGQPVQVYLMSKDSISVPKGSTILFNKFIIYQMAVTFYSLVMFIFKIGFVLSDAKAAVPFVIIGFILNLIVLIGIILLFYRPNWVRPIILFGYKLVHKIGLVKNLDELTDRLDKSMAEYNESIEKIKENKKESLKLLVLTLIQLTCYFSITYFIYLALGLDEASFLDIVAIQSLVHMAASYIPTPGTAGASEGGYYLLFKPLFTKNLLAYSMLLWRAISYYFRLVVTGIVTLMDMIIRRRKSAVI